MYCCMTSRTRIEGRTGSKAFMDVDITYSL